jgi:hypothetical protein
MTAYAATLAAGMVLAASAATITFDSSLEVRSLMVEEMGLFPVSSLEAQYRGQDTPRNAGEGRFCCLSWMRGELSKRLRLSASFSRVQSRMRDPEAKGFNKQ